MKALEYEWFHLPGKKIENNNNNKPKVLLSELEMDATALRSRADAVAIERKEFLRLAGGSAGYQLFVSEAAAHAHADRHWPCFVALHPDAGLVNRALRFPIPEGSNIRICRKSVVPPPDVRALFWFGCLVSLSLKKSSLEFIFHTALTFFAFVAARSLAHSLA